MRRLLFGVCGTLFVVRCHCLQCAIIIICSTFDVAFTRCPLLVDGCVFVLDVVRCVLCVVGVCCLLFIASVFGSLCVLFVVHWPLFV